MVEVPVRRRSARIEGISEREPSAEKSAHETVDKSADVAHESINRAAQGAERARRAVEPTLERAREAVEPAKEAVEREVVEPAAEAARKTTRVVKKKVSGITKRAFEVMDQTAHRFEQEGRETRTLLMRFLDFCLGTISFPVRWAWSTNQLLWNAISPGLGLTFGVLAILTLSWLVLRPIVFETDYSQPGYGSRYERYTPTGDKLRDWKYRLKETMRGRYAPTGHEPGSPEDRYGWDHLDQSKRNKILRYVEHLHVDNSYRIPLEMRHLKEDMMGGGGIFRWPLNRFMDFGNALGRRWNHMLIDAKYGLRNSWNALGYYIFAPFRAIEHTAEHGWERMKHRAEDISDRVGERYDRTKRHMRQAFRQPIREYERHGLGEQITPPESRDKYYYYDRHTGERPYYDYRVRREENIPDKAHDILLGGKDYLQEKAGDVLDWTKEKTESAMGWTKEKLPKDLTEFGDIIQETMKDLDDQYHTARKKTLDEIHDLQGKIEHRRYERRGGVLGWVSSWFW